MDVVSNFYDASKHQCISNNFDINALPRPRVYQTGVFNKADMIEPALITFDHENNIMLIKTSLGVDYKIKYKDILSYYTEDSALLLNSLEEEHSRLNNSKK